MNKFRKRLIAAIVIAAISMVAFVMMLVHPGAEEVTTPSPLPSTPVLDTITPPLETTSPDIQLLQDSQDDYDEEPIITEYFTLRLSNIAGQDDRFGIVTISTLNAIIYTFPADTRVTVRATAASGHEFAGWHDNASGTGRAISTSRNFSFNITEDTNLYARFRTADDTGVGKDTNLMRVSEPPPPSPPPPLPPGVVNFHSRYRSHVIVVPQPPRYSFVEHQSGERVYITVYTPDDRIRSLVVGNTFVLEPTTYNPDGMSGVITNIAGGAGGRIYITANLPTSLEDIFYEFDFEADLDALAMVGTDEFLDGSLKGTDGVSILRNTNTLVSIGFDNANIGGVTLNGNIEILRPSVNVSLSLRDLGRLTLRTEASVTITARTPDGGPFDEVIRLFNIRMRVLGTGIDIPVGIRIFSSNASGTVGFTLGIVTEFGFGGRPSPIPNVPTITPTLALYDHREAYDRIGVTLNIQARARVLWIPVYGVEGNLGKGVRNVVNPVPTCTCRISDVFPVMYVRSLDWGALRRFSFKVDVAANQHFQNIFPIRRWHNPTGTPGDWKLGMPTSTCGP